MLLLPLLISFLIYTLSLASRGRYSVSYLCCFRRLVVNVAPSRSSPSYKRLQPMAIIKNDPVLWKALEGTLDLMVGWLVALGLEWFQRRSTQTNDLDYRTCFDHPSVILSTALPLCSSLYLAKLCSRLPQASLWKYSPSVYLVGLAFALNTWLLPPASLVAATQESAVRVLSGMKVVGIRLQQREEDVVCRIKLLLHGMTIVLCFVLGCRMAEPISTSIHLIMMKCYIIREKQGARWIFHLLESIWCLTLLLTLPYWLMVGSTDLSLAFFSTSLIVVTPFLLQIHLQQSPTSHYVATLPQVTSQIVVMAMMMILSLYHGSPLLSHVDTKAPQDVFSEAPTLASVLKRMQQGDQESYVSLKTILYQVWEKLELATCAMVGPVCHHVLLVTSRWWTIALIYHTALQLRKQQ